MSACFAIQQTSIKVHNRIRKAQYEVSFKVFLFVHVMIKEQLSQCNTQEVSCDFLGIKGNAPIAWIEKTAATIVPTK